MRRRYGYRANYALWLADDEQYSLALKTAQNLTPRFKLFLNYTIAYKMGDQKTMAHYAAQMAALEGNGFIERLARKIKSK